MSLPLPSVERWLVQTRFPNRLDVGSNSRLERCIHDYRMLFRYQACVDVAASAEQSGKRGAGSWRRSLVGVNGMELLEGTKGCE